MVIPDDLDELPISNYYKYRQQQQLNFRELASKPKVSGLKVLK